MDTLQRETTVVDKPEAENIPVMSASSNDAFQRMNDEHKTATIERQREIETEWLELDKARRDEKASRIKAIEIAQNATIPHYTDFIVDCRADPFREIERFITECDIWVVNDVDKIFFVQLNFRDEVSEGKVEMITEANMKREVNIYFDQFT